MQILWIMQKDSPDFCGLRKKFAVFSVGALQNICPRVPSSHITPLGLNLRFVRSFATSFISSRTYSISQML